MAYGMEVKDLTFIAAADLSAKQYYAVYLSAANSVDVSGANGKVIGILQNKPTAGQEAVVRSIGVSKHIVNEEMAVGKFITAVNGGKGEIVDAAGEFCYGIALEAATAQNDIIAIQLTHFTAHASDA